MTTVAVVKGRDAWPAFTAGKRHSAPSFLMPGFGASGVRHCRGRQGLPVRYGGVSPLQRETAHIPGLLGLDAYGDSATDRIRCPYR